MKTTICYEFDTKTVLSDWITDLTDLADMIVHCEGYNKFDKETAARAISNFLSLLCDNNLDEKENIFNDDEELTLKEAWCILNKKAE